MKTKTNENICFKLLFVLIFGTTIYLRIKGILTQSFWNDELYSIFASNPSHSLKKILLLQTKDAHPPLYQILLWLNFKIFGYSELSARGFSAFFGIAGVFAFYFFLKNLFNKHTAVLGTAIASTTVILIWYSQETRSYSLLFFLTVISSILFIKLYEKSNVKNFLLYSFSAIAIIYTHYFGAFVLLGHGITATLLFILNPKKNKRFFIKMCLAGVMVILSFTPWLQYFIHNRMISKTWIEKPEISFFPRYFYFYWKRASKPVLLVFLIGIFGFFKESFFQKEKKKASFAIIFISSMMFSLYLIPFLISIYKTPILLPRTTIVGVPFLTAFICYPFNFWRKRELILFIAIFYLLISFYQIEKHQEILRYTKKEQVREILNIIKENYISKSNKTLIYSHYSAYLSSYSKMLNLNLKIKRPNLHDFFKKLKILKKNDAIIIVNMHNFKKTINPLIYKFIKENCILEKRIQLNKAEAEVYKVLKNEFCTNTLNSNLVPTCVKEGVFIKNKVFCSPEGIFSLKPLILTKGKYLLILEGQVVKGNNLKLKILLNGKMVFDSEISEHFNLKLPLTIESSKQVNIEAIISPASMILPELLKIKGGDWEGILKKIKNNIYSAKWTNKKSGEKISDTLIFKTFKEENIQIFRRKLQGYYRGYYDKKLNIVLLKRDWYKKGNATISCKNRNDLCFHQKIVEFDKVKIILKKKEK